ncbi:MAG: 2-C-methyl-D-erythritol 2,4-cyclodiphosphate synthase [Candidatus Omnitrophica bacterium]|nr:2-C-methyl-D-erythritol 2,4-cyclodiphosphate synthase [Candidatus Omnitrophota bacterium]
MSKVKIGFGYDIHPLREGRSLILGGIQIPFSKGLLGHSDADVLIHAVCDAILGALGKGDIGEIFPDTDPAYKDMASSKLLDVVFKLMTDAGFKIGNIDTVIVAEQPKISQVKERMKEKLAAILHSRKDDINIKATTAEGLGPIGNNEAIACFATAIIIEGA